MNIIIITLVFTPLFPLEVDFLVNNVNQRIFTPLFPLDLGSCNYFE